MNETKVIPKLYHYHGNLIKWASHSLSSLLWSSLFIPALLTSFGRNDGKSVTELLGESFSKLYRQTVLARSRYILSHFFFGLLCLKFWPSLFSSVVFDSLSKSLFSFFVLYMDWPSGRITECEVYVVACCQSQRADNSFLPGNHTESSITQYAFAHVEDSTRCTNEKRSISAFLINVLHFNMCYYYVDR